MIKKALLVTTVSGFVPQFEMNNVRILQQMGYEVHYAANYLMPSYENDNCRLNGTGIVRHQIDFVRSPYSLKNWAVYQQMKRLMEKEHFQLIHCHTPMGGVMARLAARVSGTKPVIYTAHGFHFYRGAPIINWLFYFPMERWLSRHTDQILCINQEDYRRAASFHARCVDYIPGAGIALEKIGRAGKDRRCSVANKKRELGIPMDKQILLSAGELIKRKNHESAIRAVAKLTDLPLVYVICGHGEREPYLRALAKKLGVEDRVIFAGYRSDMLEIYPIADLYLFPSYQEGLPMALLEAMASGLPVVCSDVRGNRDLMGEKPPGTFEGKPEACRETWADRTLWTKRRRKWTPCAGGAMVQKVNNGAAYAEAVRYILKSPEQREQCGKRNAAEAEKYSLKAVEKVMREIYKRWDKNFSGIQN